MNSAIEQVSKCMHISTIMEYSVCLIILNSLDKRVRHVKKIVLGNKHLLILPLELFLKTFLLARRIFSDELASETL